MAKSTTAAEREFIEKLFIKNKRVLGRATDAAMVAALLVIAQCIALVAASILKLAERK